jgi:chloride channel 3/4/5
MGGLAQTFIPHHELICVGAAAGVATAFNAPLGGVLFVIEELGTGRSSGGGLSKRVLLLCFVSTFSATFAIKYMDLNSTNEMLLFSSSAETKKKEWKAWEVIPFSCLGIVAGIVGTLFIKANLWVSERRRRMEKKGRLWCLPDSAIQHELWQKMLPTAFLRWAEVWVPSQSEPFGEDTAHLRPSLISVVEVFLIAVFTGITNYMHPSLKPLSFTTIGALLEACPNEKIQAFGFCVEQSDGHSNLGGNVFEKFKLFGIVGGAFIIRFAQTVITFGSMIPAGLFIPSLFMGACLGRGVGHFVRWNGETNDQAHVEPGIYAAVGAVAMLAGFTRMTVSLVVIMFEITGGVENIIPFMIAVFIAKRVGDCLSNGIYESHMQLQGMPVVDPPSNFRVGHLTVSDLTDYSEFVFVASPQATYTVDQVITCLENDRPCVVLDEDEQLVGVIIDNPSVLDHLSLLDVGSYRAVFDDHHHVLAENTICIAQFVCKNVIEMAGDAPVLTAYRAFAEQPDLQAIISYSTYEEDCNRIFVLSKLGFARKMINSGEVPLVSCISHKMFRKDPEDQESRS